MELEGRWPLRGLKERQWALVVPSLMDLCARVTFCYLLIGTGDNRRKVRAAEMPHCVCIPT